VIAAADPAMGTGPCGGPSDPARGTRGGPTGGSQEPQSGADMDVEIDKIPIQEERVNCPY